MDFARQQGSFCPRAFQRALTLSFKPFDKSHSRCFQHCELPWQVCLFGLQTSKLSSALFSCPSNPGYGFCKLSLLSVNPCYDRHHYEAEILCSWLALNKWMFAFQVSDLPLLIADSNAILETSLTLSLVHIWLVGFLRVYFYLFRDF